jgi:membrane-associated phospholipid phosphatase
VVRVVSAPAVVAAFVLLAGGGPAPATAQELGPGEVAFWAASGATLLAAWHLDDELRRDDASLRGPAAHRLAGIGYELGGRRTLIPAFVGALVVTQVAGWPTEPERVLHVLAGAAGAGLVTEGIKHTVGRGRPREVDDPRQFRPFSRRNAWMAFPSGHATAGFGVAAALAEEFDLGGFEWVGYGLAGLIAWSRVYDDAHWASDTVAGAIVGIAVARATVGWLNRGRDPGTERQDGDTAPGIPVLLIRISLP